MATDPFAALEQDHRKVEQLLATLETCDEGQRGALVAELEQALTTHMQFEETEVYPLVSQQMGAETADEAISEHEEAREGLMKLRDKVHVQQFNDSVNAQDFTTTLDTVKQGITHHVQEEEGEVFPRLREQLDDETKKRLAAAKPA